VVVCITIVLYKYTLSLNDIIVWDFGIILYGRDLLLHTVYTGILTWREETDIYSSLVINSMLTRQELPGFFYRVNIISWENVWAFHLLLR